MTRIGIINVSETVPDPFVKLVESVEFTMPRTVACPLTKTPLFEVAVVQPGLVME